ncbi:MAG: EAL domain-containing protein [Burkholderiales bacterium]|nr:EAL domain-containing protein [Burkholderiales bacterium]
MNSVGTWTWDKETGDFGWSAGMCKIAGLPAKAIRLSETEARAYYSPPTWALLHAALHASASNGNPIDIECLLLTGTGSRWVRQRSEPCPDDDRLLRGIAEADEGAIKTHLHLQGNEHDLIQLLNSLPVCIAYIDTEFRCQFINDTYLTWFGIQQLPVAGEHFSNIIGQVAFDALLKYMEVAFLGSPVSCQSSIPRQHGGARDISTEFLPLHGEDGAVKGCYVIVYDITQHKQVEEQLRINEERWQLALESSGDGVWDWYPQIGVELLSDRLKKIYGYGPDEIANLSDELDRRTHPDDTEQMYRDRADHFAGRTPIYINEHRVQCKDGRWKWILSRGTVIQRDAEGKPLRMVGTHTDISERKNAEVALKESEERLRTALSATHQGLYDLNVQTGVAIVNAEYASMLGYAHDDFHESRDKWLQRLHPDDYAVAAKAFDNYVKGVSNEYRAEFRQKKANGEWIWVLSVGALVERDANGQPRRMLGTVLDVTDKKKSEALIWQQANIDALTGLPNRRMFYDRLDRDIRKSKRTGLPLAVLFIDLDYFKEVNDTLGHATGDALLVEAARRLRQCVRDSDTVARLGGDEFTVSLPDQHDPMHAETIAENIIRAMTAPFQLGEEEIFLSASIGITMFPADASTLDDLVKHADQAMYAAKDHGRNRFCYFTPSMQVAAQTRLRLSSELRTAISERKLLVYFQPIVDLKSGHIQKAEALIRWQHPQMGFVSPLEFIPIAESTGLIQHIGEWVFQQSVKWVKEWRAQYHPDFQISVNQSPIEFQSDQNRYASWIQHLHAVDLPGQAISIEITEGLLLDANDKIENRLLQFRDAGIQVAIDDFGTGYSSLSYLNKFDIDYLKIDQSFVRNLTPGSNEFALSEAIIMMAHKLGLSVVAEGVETVQQRDLLRQAGCDFAQGYLFAKPLPPQEFAAMLAQFQPDPA